MYGQAILFLGVVIFFSFILVNEKGGFLFYPYIEKKINNYFEKNYSSLTNIKKDSLQYDKSKKFYYITYYNQKNKDLNFSISYKKGKIKSNYQKNYKEGYSLLQKREQTIKKQIEKIFLDTNFKITSVSFYKLTDYLENEIEIIKKEKNLVNSAYYILNIEYNTNNLDNYENVILPLSQLLNQNNIIPEKIFLTLKKRADHRKITLEKGDDNLWIPVYSAES